MVGVRVSLSPGRVVRRTAPVTVLVLLASYLVAPEFAGAAPPPQGPTVPAGRSVPVTPVAGKTPSKPGTDTLPGWSAGSPVRPAGGTGTVTVDTDGGGGGGDGNRRSQRPGSPGVGTVGGLPLRVRKQGPAGSDPASDPRSEASAADAPAPTTVRVSVAGQEVAQQAGIDGVLFTLARGDGSTVPTAGCAGCGLCRVRHRLRRRLRWPVAAGAAARLRVDHTGPAGVPRADPGRWCGECDRVACGVGERGRRGRDGRGTFPAPAGTRPNHSSAGSLTGDPSSVVPAGTAGAVVGVGVDRADRPRRPRPPVGRRCTR